MSVGMRENRDLGRLLLRSTALVRLRPEPLRVSAIR